MSNFLNHILILLVIGFISLFYLGNTVYGHADDSMTVSSPTTLYFPVQIGGARGSLMDAKTRVEIVAGVDQTMREESNHSIVKFSILILLTVLIIILFYPRSVKNDNNQSQLP